jgi:hypothetical protein
MFVVKALIAVIASANWASRLEEVAVEVVSWDMVEKAGEVERVVEMIKPL